MPEKKNLVTFPRSAKKRKQLLLQAESLKLRRLTRLRTAVGWALLFAAALFAASHFTLFTPSSIVRNFQIVRTVLFGSNNIAEGAISYPAGSASAAAPLAGGLAVIDDESLSVLQLGDITQQSTPLGYASPCLQSNASHVLTFDRGGYDVTLASPLTPVLQLKLRSPILNASLGSDDRFVIVTDEAGYKSAVTVYSPISREDDHHLWRWRTPDYYVQDAALSPSGNHLCALTFHQNGASLETILQFFDLDADTVRQTVSLGPVVGYTVRWLDDSNAAVITDQAAYTVNRRGELHTAAQYAASDLLGFSFGSDGFVLARRSFTGEARAEIVRFDKNGETKATLPMTSAPESLSYADGRLAVLTGNGLYVYNSALQPDWKNESAGAAQRVTLTSDGGVWLYYPKYAQRVTASSAQSEDFTHDSADPD